MAYRILGYDLADVQIVSGADPFADDVNPNDSAVGSVFRLNAGATPDVIEVIDDDDTFDDGDTDQDLRDSLTQDGGTAPAGERITPEYSYVIRPVGSSDPADNITIYVYELGLDGDGDGFASTARIKPGVDYQIVAVDDDHPSVAASDLFVCFAAGTRIRTPQGDVPVEELQPGDLVMTLDEGPQPLRWSGARRIGKKRLAEAPEACPVKIRRGALGGGLPKRALVVSPQHRLMVRSAIAGRMFGAQEVLVAAVQLVGLPGIERYRPKHGVHYVHLRLDRHQIVLAEGAPAETLLFAPGSLAALSVAQRAELRAIFPHLSAFFCGASEVPARPLAPGRRGRNLRARHAGAGRPVLLQMPHR